MNELLDKANRIFLENFPNEVVFGRCIFLSWYCKRGTCKFCFRSTIEHKERYESNARRTPASIYTDAILGKNLGWELEFLTGGYGMYDDSGFDNFVENVRIISEIFQKKIWINVGVLAKEELLKLKPYVEGICASIETVNTKLHKELCPDKNIKEYEDFLDTSEELGFRKSITIIIGVGETKDDFALLEKFIAKHKLDRITFYALKPVKGTMFTRSPDPDYYAWWVASTRIKFPKMRIAAGLTPKNPDFAENIARAGVNIITKFPAVKEFGSEKAMLVEALVRKAGRKFISSLTVMPKIDWSKEVDRLDVGSYPKQKIKDKLGEYVKDMSRSR